MAESSTVRPTGGSGPEQHQGWWLIAWRKLDLVHDGRPFLRRLGFDLFGDRIGIYLHHITGADPGKDLHDHPWPFLTVVLSGAYTEEWTDTADTDHGRVLVSDGERCFQWANLRRTWPRGHFRIVGEHFAHRITSAEPGTYTLVLRLPKRRDWGFYLPDGWVWWRDYDYATRRPNTAVSSKTEENHSAAENPDDPNPSEHPCAGACRGCGAGPDEACIPPCRCDNGEDCDEAKRIIAQRPPELLADFLDANPQVADAIVAEINRTRGQGWACVAPSNPCTGPGDCHQLHDCGPVDPEISESRWWVIGERALLAALRRTRRGDSPDVVLMELTANSDAGDPS